VSFTHSLTKQTIYLFIISILILVVNFNLHILWCIFSTSAHTVCINIVSYRLTPPIGSDGDVSRRIVSSIRVRNRLITSPAGAEAMSGNAKERIHNSCLPVANKAFNWVTQADTRAISLCEHYVDGNTPWLFRISEREETKYETQNNSHLYHIQFRYAR